MCRSPAQVPQAGTAVDRFIATFTLGAARHRYLTPQHGVGASERRDKMGAGDISGGASLWRPTTSRHIAPSVNDPVDFFVTHFQGPSRREPATSRRDIAPSVNTTYQFILAADMPSATLRESPAEIIHSAILLFDLQK